MPKEELKALTVVNLPFIGKGGLGKRFMPGDSIPRADFDAYAERAAELVDNKDDNVRTADEVIEHMIEWGSISEDPDAELHPDHLPVDPGQPTIAQLIEQAKTLVADLENRQQEVPEGLQALANTEHQHIGATDQGVAS